MLGSDWGTLVQVTASSMGLEKAQGAGRSLASEDARDAVWVDATFEPDHRLAMAAPSIRKIPLLNTSFCLGAQLGFTKGTVCTRFQIETLLHIQLVYL